jgi:hypothetical protein
MCSVKCDWSRDAVTVDCEAVTTDSEAVTSEAVTDDLPLDNL